ncbi:MAG: hypothetical protein RJQ10_11015 [Haliea sp.]|uniref:hypothetical protein n=1 Tax=Haliea sp. TaxID=1932666 RepID=UPI0032EB544E
MDNRLIRAFVVEYPDVQAPRGWSVTPAPAGACNAALAPVGKRAADSVTTA